MRLFIIMVELKSRNLHSENMALQGLSTVSVAVTISVRPSTSNLVRIPSSSLCQVPSPRIRIGSVRCKAVGENQQQVYNGVYGPWTVEAEDVKEVPPSPHSIYVTLSSVISVERLGYNNIILFCKFICYLSHYFIIIMDHITIVLFFFYNSTSFQCFVDSSSNLETQMKIIDNFRIQLQAF